MRIIGNVLGMVGSRRPSQGLHDLERAGYEYVPLDFRLFCNEQAFAGMKRNRQEALECGIPFLPDHPEQVPEAAKAYLAALGQTGLKMPAALTTSLPRDRSNPELNEILKPIVEEEVRLAARQGCDALVVRPLYAGIPCGEEWERNRAYLLKLASIVREEHSSMQLLLENQSKYIEGHLVRGTLSDPAEVIRWLDALNTEAFALKAPDAASVNPGKKSGGTGFSKDTGAAAGESTGKQEREPFAFCLDVGTANLCGQDVYELCTALGDRIRAVLLRDCNGHSDDALLPFTSIEKHGCQTDWLSVIRGLRTIHFDGDLIMDFHDSLANFPNFLWPQLLKLSKELADYLHWQIHMGDAMRRYRHIVLFGAGNMCRNYMKNYGEEFPPLFTCDNNESRWGEEFCGLTIEPPEKLKSLPEGTAVFICNLYYREIEQQLRGMGIRNPIEYFNDQYLNTFYMDRLKGL